MIIRAQNRPHAAPMPVRPTKPIAWRSEPSLHQTRAVKFLEQYTAHVTRQHQAQVGEIQGDPRGGRVWYYVPVQSLGPKAQQTGVLNNQDDYDRYRVQFMSPFDQEVASFIKQKGRDLAPHLFARFFYGICGRHDSRARFHVAGSFFALVLHKLQPGLTPNQRQMVIHSIDADFSQWSRRTHSIANLPPLYAPFDPSQN